MKPKKINFHKVQSRAPQQKQTFRQDHNEPKVEALSIQELTSNLRKRTSSAKQKKGINT